MLNGALFGGIGGALGAMLEFAIKKRWGTTALAIGAVVGWIIGQSVEQGFNFAGDQVYRSIVRPRVDRAALEQRLLSDPKMKWLQVLRQREPTIYAAYIEAIVTRARSGEPFDATVNYVRKTFVEPLFASNAPYLSDEATNRYLRLIANQMDAFSQTNPRLCVLALRSEPMGDIRPYVTDAIATEELQLLEEALVVDKRQARVRYTEAEQQKLIELVVAKIALQQGDRVQLLDPAATVAGREREVCGVAAAFFRGILALPPTQSAALMRSILGVPQK
jgi:hypothetical protein